MCQSKAQGGKRCALHGLGTRAMLAVVRTGQDLDRVQGDAVFRKTHLRARPNKNDPSPAKWAAFLDARIERLALEVDPDDFDRLARRLHAAKQDVPDARTFAALADLELRAQKATSAIRRQVNAVAALRGVGPAEAAERFAAYRDQYRKDLHRLPADQRPDPPEAWVRGFTTKDMMAVSCPDDRATLYALYRCQSDPEAFTARPGTRYASIDLETAGPTGKTGFIPENGSIIEVGIVEYDADGTETARYNQLIAPDPEVAATCGTGAVEVHGISLADVADAPEWSEVAPTIASHLSGRVLMAQNYRFERDWLGHHMQAAGQDFDRWGPTVDTMCLAKQHYPDMPNHRLATICEAVGVDYTDGHRALHDAEVAARAFFAIRGKITAEYLSSPVRVNTPQPPPGAGHRRRVIRMSTADFDPATVADPWARPAVVPVA